MADVYSLYGNYLRDAQAKSDIIAINGAEKFDTSNITILSGVVINGSNGGASANGNYVATDYIDVSNRIGSEVSFRATIKANPIGFAIYDKGRNYIDGVWGNMPGLSDLGFVSRNEPQDVTWNLAENAYYVRACMPVSNYSKPDDFAFDFYQNPNARFNMDYDNNFLTIAHKGYGGSNIANTLRSFINAADAGFKAVEIDCRKTADGVFVCAHNDTNTLYANGTSATYAISESTWAELKGKTVDADGNHPIPTLASVFNTLRKYRIIFVIDLKTGTNAEIIALARRCGVTDNIILSYYSYANLSADLTFLAKYPEISVRFTPYLTQAQFNAVRSAIKNKLYADINFSENTRRTYIPCALALHLPILASGITSDTAKIMGAISAGAMSNLTLQYSPKNFKDMISLNYQQFPTLTANTDSVNVATGGTATVTVLTSIDDSACWAFAYSDDLAVFDVSQTAFGATATISVSGVSTGTANLVVFTATGEQLIIPVTVS